MNAIFYLSDAEAAELRDLLRSFQQEHIEPRADAKPWDIALLAYPADDCLPHLQMEGFHGILYCRDTAGISKRHGRGSFRP
ncbi:MAG: hypothetical protein ACTTHL_05000 [Oribacterium sp.]